MRQISLGLLAALALSAAIYPAHAGDEDAAPVAQDASFDSAFAAFDKVPSAEQALPHAVDIGDIDPPREGTARSLGRGMASYYGRSFAGRRTASGETFDPQQLTAAHRTLPFGSKVKVTNPANGRSVVVRINDRGPFSRGRVIDLSHRAAEDLGLIRSGHGEVELALVGE